MIKATSLGYRINQSYTVHQQPKIHLFSQGIGLDVFPNAHHCYSFFPDEENSFHVGCFCLCCQDGVA